MKIRSSCYETHKWHDKESDSRLQLGMAKWWERLPPTNVGLGSIPLGSHVGWVCCRFSSLLWGFFSGFSSFPSSTKKPTFLNSNSIWNRRATGLSVVILWSATLFVVSHCCWFFNRLHISWPQEVSSRMLSISSMLFYWVSLYWWWTANRKSVKHSNC